MPKLMDFLDQVAPCLDDALSGNGFALGPFQVRLASNASDRRAPSTVPVAPPEAVAPPPPPKYVPPAPFAAKVPTKKYAHFPEQKPVAKPRFEEALVSEGEILIGFTPRKITPAAKENPRPRSQGLKVISAATPSVPPAPPPKEATQPAKKTPKNISVVSISREEPTASEKVIIDQIQAEIPLNRILSVLTEAPDGVAPLSMLSAWFSVPPKIMQLALKEYVRAGDLVSKDDGYAKA